MIGNLTLKNNFVKTQFTYLFVSNFIVLFIGMGLFPVLPLYAAQFGASHSLVGIFFAIMYVSNASGPLAAGWLAGRMPRKTLFVISGLLGIPALLLLGQAKAFWQVVVLTSVVWFSGGLNLNLSSVYAGLYAKGEDRGKLFSLLALSSPLGALVGGTTVGRLVSWGGYLPMFTALAFVWALLPLVGMVGLVDREGDRQNRVKNADRSENPGTGRRLMPLLPAVLLSATLVAVSRLGSSLSMQELGFTAEMVASTATVGGLASMPVSMLIGALSDRMGRKRLLLITYLVAAGGALTLSQAHQLWHFWLAASLLLVAFSSNGALSKAMATDLLPRQDLDRGLSWVNTTASTAGILSFAGAGYALDLLGPQTVFLLAASLGALAMLQLSRLGGGKTQMPAAQPVEEGSTCFNPQAYNRSAELAPELSIC
jgi:MFS family permease